jgi:hypothetical protein
VASFRTVIQLHGKSATGIEVPADVVDALGAGKHPKVRVTLRGYSYASSVAAMRGKFLVPVSADVRAKAGVAAGDEVVVDLVVDASPRTVEVPEDLAAALDGSPGARRAFDGLSHSNRARYVASVEGAKTPDTRARRIARALSDLEAAAG